MFQFIHTADLHLDSPLRGLSRYEAAPVEQLRGASRRALAKLVDLAIETGVAFVLIAGDLYDGDWKDYSTGIYLGREMGRLRDAGIPVFAVLGNHDAASRLTKALRPPSNMTIFPTGAASTIEVEGVSVAIHGQSYSTPRMSENLAVHFPERHPDRFNIGMLHTCLNGREGHANYAPCNIDQLRAKGYDYWALGHVHQREIVCRDPWIVYPGCPQGRHIREVGPKGCSLVTVDDDEVRVEHRDLDVLRWAACRVDLSDVDTMDDALTVIGQAISTTQEMAGELPVAMRVWLEGASSIASNIAARPKRMEQQVRAIAAEFGGGDVWVEKVIINTTRPRNLDGEVVHDDALGELLKKIQRLPEQRSSVAELDDELERLMAKLPPEVMSPETGVTLNDEETITKLIAEAKKMLIGRLLRVGEGS